MPFRTKVQYFDREDGTEIDKKKVKNYIIVKRNKRYEFNKYDGWTTCYITAECERNRQTKLL